MIQPACRYTIPHRCEIVPVEKHAAAWATMTPRLNLHLERNHGVKPPSNPADWATFHVMRHEQFEDHSLEIPPDSLRAKLDDQIIERMEAK
jgi:hypothetical protein